MAEDWSDIEVELIVADYFSMLMAEISGTPYNKSEHRRGIIKQLNNRNEGSIEFKHQNISAVLAKFGVPWIQGYKPLANYQNKLEQVVAHYLQKNTSLEHSFKEFAEGEVRNLQLESISYTNFVESPPETQLVKEPELTYSGPVKVNYLEIEQNNKRLGDSGEEVVIKYEQWRLTNAGKDSLADKIEWVAQTEGDWIGYDILSKNTNGTDRHIEVKTTKLSKDAPIFFSKNEYEFSARNASSYFLYRVFNFNKAPKVFIVNGRFDEFCRFQPIKFKGHF